MRHTKIIATIGPSSNTRDVIDQLIAAGADVFRLNFSHGTQADHAAVFAMIRDAAARADRHIPILQDLSGPKIRTGRLAGGQALPLERGARLRIVIGDGIGEPGTVFTTYEPLARAVSHGDRLLLDDGHVELRVESASPAAIETTVVDGGSLGERKGINAPGVPLPDAGVTAKDERDLAFGLALGIDVVALSFVQSPSDLVAARSIMAGQGHPETPIIAKLERPEAIEHLDAILAAADGVMVARGDLGLEIPFERVPRVQREVLRRARAAGVPAILATQVLESMRTEPRPSRAEVSDAANAVNEGADAIMLSGETAAGAYPVRAVTMLDAIIREAESGDGTAAPAPAANQAAAFCSAAVTLARELVADAIVAVTREGRTARLLSMLRPRAPIYAATDREDVARRMGYWCGTRPLIVSIEGDVDLVATRVIDRLRQSGQISAGATIVLVNATPGVDHGAANFIKVRRT